MRYTAERCNECTAIATVLSDMDAEIAALETKLAKPRQIKQGMMQELLTGHIRLIEPPLPQEDERMLNQTLVTPLRGVTHPAALCVASGPQWQTHGT